jgi:hypothetical protein
MLELIDLFEIAEFFFEIANSLRNRNAYPLYRDVASKGGNHSGAAEQQQRCCCGRMDCPLSANSGHRQPYSINSSARASSADGMPKPSDRC